MAGVGRGSDFGKSEYGHEDIENRLDTTDPFYDDTIPFEKRVRALMDRGMTREQAEEWVRHALVDKDKTTDRRVDILREQTAFRKQVGDLKHCTLVDESCMPPEDETNKK